MNEAIQLLKPHYFLYWCLVLMDGIAEDQSHVIGWGEKNSWWLKFWTLSIHSGLTTHKVLEAASASILR